MYLLDCIENKVCDAIVFAIMQRNKILDKKEAKEKAKAEAAQARTDKVEELVSKLKLNKTAYTEDGTIFYDYIKSKGPAIIAKYDIANARSVTHKTHFIDNDGSIKELNNTEKYGYINFVDKAMKNIDKYQKAKTDLQRKTVTLEEGFIRGIEYYDYKLLNDGSVVFVKL